MRHGHGLAGELLPSAGCCPDEPQGALPIISLRRAFQLENTAGKKPRGMRHWALVPGRGSPVGFAGISRMVFRSFMSLML